MPRHDPWAANYLHTFGWVGFILQNAQTQKAKMLWKPIKHKEGEAKKE